MVKKFVQEVAPYKILWISLCSGVDYCSAVNDLLPGGHCYLKRVLI